MKSLHIQISSILLYFLPAALVTGPFLSDLIISLIASIFIYISFKEKIFYYYKSIFFIIFFIFYIYITTRSLFAENLLMSLKSSVFYIRFGIFSLAVWYLLDKSPQILKTFTFSIFITFGIVILDAYIQILFGKNILGMVNESAYKVSGLFGDKLVLGSYLSRLMPLAFGCLFLMETKNPSKKIFFAIFFVITAILILYSGERTALFFTLLFSIGIIFFMKKWLKIRIIVIALFFIIGSLVISTNEKVKIRTIDNTLAQLGLIISQDSEEKKLHNRLQVIFFSPSHTIHIMTAYNMFKGNILFGHGVKMFREICAKKDYYINERSCRTHPHNTYIQILAETGLLGFVFILSAFIYVSFSILFGKSFFHSNKTDKKFNDHQKCLLFCFLITLWPFIPSGSFFNNWISIIYFLPVGFYLHSLYKKI